METRFEHLSVKYDQLSEENQAKVFRLFPASCNGLTGSAAYLPSVERNADALEALIHRLTKEQNR